MNPVEGISRTVEARLVHGSPGRLRLHIPEFVGDGTGMEQLAEALADLRGITRITGRPQTGSLIIRFEGDMPSLVSRLLASGLVRFATPAGLPPPVAAAARAKWSRLDNLVMTASSGAFDVRSALAVVFFAAAALQATRGRFLGPTSTLLVSAISLLTKDRDV